MPSREYRPGTEEVPDAATVLPLERGSGETFRKPPLDQAGEVTG